VANAAFGSGGAGSTIRTDRDFAAHLDYTHFNPVKHGLAKHPADRPHSSFRQCVARGLYPAGWIGGNKESLETGERR
jgi:putative transposase